MTYVFGANRFPKRLNLQGSHSPVNGPLCPPGEFLVLLKMILKTTVTKVCEDKKTMIKTSQTSQGKNENACYCITLHSSSDMGSELDQFFGEQKGSRNII